MIEEQGAGVDVLAQPCPTARVETRLPLTLVEQIDGARGQLPRAGYLAIVIEAAMTREHPQLPDDGGEDGEWIDELAKTEVQAARGQRRDRE